jgi:sulfate transport system ATP-binding protein
MSFLGPVTTLGGQLVRPHDIHVSTRPTTGAHRATLERVVSLGFETRIVATPAGGGEPVTVQLTRNQVHELALEVGDTVYLNVPHVAAA